MPTIRKQVTFAPELIDSDAERVVRYLAEAGHKAFLVGGCVRDLLLERTPKDFDVATSATPNEIRHLFRNCRIIGRRFRLAHIFFGNKIIETSTFRANPRADFEEDEELFIRRDNVFGSPTQDALRRDFTINGLFYDPRTEEVIDHVGGLADLEARIVRTIGDPDIRFREDPIRMLRAIKFAARLDFHIEEETLQALLTHKTEISKCPSPRVVEETYRLLRGGAARRSMQHMVDTGVVRVLSSQMAALFSPKPESTQPPTQENGSKEPLTHEERWRKTWTEDENNLGGLTRVIPNQQGTKLSARQNNAWRILEDLDEKMQRGEPLSNALLLAAITTPFVLEDVLQSGIRTGEAISIVNKILQPLVSELHVARRDAERARQIVLAQRRMAPSRRRRGKPMNLVGRDFFGEALSIFTMTQTIAGHSEEEIKRWEQLRGQEKVEAENADELHHNRRPRRRRRGGRRRRRSPSAEGTMEASSVSPPEDPGPQKPI